MTLNPLTPEERKMLLVLARQALEAAVCRAEFFPLDLETVPERLRQPGATFVTLTRRGELRGCVGSLEAYQPVAEDVREHAVAAAFRDFRFLPVAADELPEIRIEVSHLTEANPLPYSCPDELLTRLRPGIDGVILADGVHRATFLPQVWEKIPDPAFFLNHLCLKMGGDERLWQSKKLQVYTYQVEQFHEEARALKSGKSARRSGQTG